VFRHVGENNIFHLSVLTLKGPDESCIFMSLFFKSAHEFDYLAYSTNTIFGLSNLVCSPQIRKHLMVSDKGLLEWKKMYFKLCRCYPHKEQYSDTLQFCTHCHILFWKV